MKIRIQDRDIIKMDRAIKIKIAATGDFTESEAFLSRIIWQMCFNPKEYKRCSKLLDTIVKNSGFKDLPECQGSLPK